MLFRIFLLLLIAISFVLTLSKKDSKTKIVFIVITFLLMIAYWINSFTYFSNF